MTDNIRPDHYRTGEIDLFESWYLTYPFNEFRAIMESIAERYMKRDKEDRIQDLDKAIYTLERLKEKEIEHREKQEKVKSNKTLKEAFDDMGKAFGGINFDEWLRKQKNADLLATYQNGGENGKVEQKQLYYAKIKGWELTEGESVFWKSCIITENPTLPRLYTGSKEEDGFVRTKMTIQYWNKVGINETNADFERVE